jgi:hypothetical protein
VIRHSSLVTAGVAAALGSALLTGTAVAAAGVAGTGAAAARPALKIAGPHWRTATPLPGLAALNLGGSASFNSISCASAGNCSAGGTYSATYTGTHLNPHLQAWVDDETSGVWGTAEEVPGTAALNTTRAATASVSCPAAGDCSAGGFYTDASGDQQVFVVDETDGTWGTATEVPGSGALNAGGLAAINSISCPTVGNCGVGGYYTDASGLRQAFVADETDGTWGTAEEVPGTAALNAGGFAAIEAVSCASPGNCGAGGSYASGNIANIPITQPFVVSEVDGQWQAAEEVPGAAALNAGGSAGVESVSCASAGNCSAGGEYTSSTPATQAFVVDETNGTWGTANDLPGSDALNAGGFAQVNSVSCASAGNCAAGGFYEDASFEQQALVASETNGTWGTAEEVPGTAALNLGTTNGATTNSVSCSAPGYCSAGGSYADVSGAGQVFAAIEVNGTWQTAKEVFGTHALNTGGQAGIAAVSCAAVGQCSAGGTYTVRHHRFVQVFVVDQF